MRFSLMLAGLCAASLSAAASAQAARKIDLDVAQGHQAARPLLRSVGRLRLFRHDEPRRCPGAAQNRGRRARLSLHPLPRDFPRRARHGEAGTGRAHHLRLDRHRQALRQPPRPAHQALRRTGLHAAGAEDVRQQDLLVERQYLAPEAGGLAQPRRRLRHPSRAALRQAAGAQLVLRGVERAQSRRLLGKGRPGGLFRAVRKHRAHDQGDRPRAPRRRPIDRGCGVGARVPVLRRRPQCADRFRHHPYLRRGRRLPRRGGQGRHQALAQTRTRSSATSTRCARRSRRRNSPTCRSISPNGAPATSRAIRSTTATSPRLDPDQAQGRRRAFSRA